jgi:hypothetical protein
MSSKTVSVQSTSAEAASALGSTSTTTKAGSAAHPGQTLPKTPTIALLVLLFFVMIAILIWAIVNYQILKSRDLRQNSSPYCLTFGCPEGSTGYPVTLDPKTETIQTMNWCSSNAPPESLYNGLNVCADGGAAPAIPAKVNGLADFYLNDYMPTCGYTWKTSDVTATTDPFIVSLVKCADAQNISDTNVESLREICGSECEK